MLQFSSKMPSFLKRKEKSLFENKEGMPRRVIAVQNQNHNWRDKKQKYFLIGKMPHSNAFSGISPSFSPVHN